MQYTRASHLAIVIINKFLLANDFEILLVTQRYGTDIGMRTSDAVLKSYSDGDACRFPLSLGRSSNTPQHELVAAPCATFVC